MADDLNPLDLTEADEQMLAASAQEVIDTAKKTFKLSDRLRGVKLATAKVLVFLDLEAVAEWQAQQSKVDTLARVANVYDAGTPENVEAVAEMTEAEELVEPLRAAAMQSALAIHMRAVPQVAFDAAQRAARGRFADDSGEIPSDKQQAYYEAQNEILMGQVILRVVDASGAEATFDRKKIAKELRESIGVVQYQRVFDQFNVLMFNDSLARAATSEAGF